MGAPEPSDVVALQRGDADAAAEIDSLSALHAVRDRADHPAERPHQRGRAALGHRDLDAELPAGGGDLGARETGADHQHPGHAPGQLPAQAYGVVAGTQHEHPVQRGLFRMDPGPCPGPGGDQQAVVGNGVPVGQAYEFGVPVQALGGDAQTPFGVDVAPPRQRGVLGARASEQRLLGQRRPVVGFVRLVADHGQRTGEALVAQGLRRAQTGQRGTDDDNAAPAPQDLDVRVSRHGVPPLGRLVGPVDKDRLDRAGGRGLLDPVTLRLVEARREQQRFVPVEGEDVRGEEDALRESLAPVEIDDKPHLESAP